jgi:phenylalanyl-tRNA synthetase alpha chain
MKMIDKIKEYIGEAQAFSTQDKAELEAFRIKFLGSKGLLKIFLRVQECS